VNRKAAIFSELLLALFLGSGPAPAQTAGASLSGIVTNPSGAVAGATITAKNLATEQSQITKTDSQGRYSFTNLPPGDYEITASPGSAVPKTSRITLVAGAPKTMNIALSGNFANPGEPSLSDLGFTPEQTKGNAQEQARLNKRSRMLKTHRRLGLITAAPFIATLITANGAKVPRYGAPGSNASGRELHAALGSVTAGLYLTTASFAIFAPKIQGTQTRGMIRLHKSLAWIHGPGRAEPMGIRAVHPHVSHLASAAPGGWCEPRRAR
jgi:hypothetical protein